MKTLSPFLLILALGLIPALGCPSSNDDDSADDDDATSDDDDATSDDDDATGDDDDSATGDDDDSATGDDDDSATGDDDDSAGGDDDDATGDDDDSAGDDDDSSGGCDVDDLVATLEVRVGAVAGTTFNTTDSLTFAGIVSNPCDIPLTVTSISTCLVGSWTASPASGGPGLGAGTACGDAPTPFLIPEGASIEETVVFGTLGAGSWTGEANFDVVSFSAASAAFTVQ